MIPAQAIPSPDGSWKDQVMNGAIGQTVRALEMIRRERFTITITISAQIAVRICMCIPHAGSLLTAVDILEATLIMVLFMSFTLRRHILKRKTSMTRLDYILIQQSKAEPLFGQKHLNTMLLQLHSIDTKFGHILSGDGLQSGLRGVKTK